MNRRTGRFYIGSSVCVVARFEQHKAAIRQMNHHNPDILNDSIWCDFSDWSFKILSRHATHDEMVRREMTLIRIFVGRKSCYNLSLDYIREPVKIEWVVFNLHNGRFRRYLNRRSAIRDLEVNLSSFALNAAGLLQYNDYLLFRPGCGIAAANSMKGLDATVFDSLKELLSCGHSAIYIYNPTLEDTPVCDHFGRLPELLDRDISVKELIKPSGRYGIATTKRSAIDGQMREGNVVVIEGPGGEIVSLTPRGRSFARYQVQSEKKANAKAAVLASVVLNKMEDLELRDLRATIAMRHAAQLAKHHPSMANELSQLPEGHYLVAVCNAENLSFHKFVAGVDSLLNLSGFGEIFGVIEWAEQFTPQTISHLGVATRHGTIARNLLPEQEEYKRKRVAWMKKYLIKGDSAAALFRISDGLLIASITSMGMAAIVNADDIRPIGFQSGFVRLIKEGFGPLIAACSISMGGCLLIVTQLGFAITIKAEGKYIVKKGDRPRKIDIYKKTMGAIIWATPLDRISCLMQRLCISTSDGRDVDMGALSDVVENKENSWRVLELIDGELVTSVTLL